MKWKPRKKLVTTVAVGDLKRMLKKYGIPTIQLSEYLGITVQTYQELRGERRGISRRVAILLSILDRHGPGAFEFMVEPKTLRPPTRNDDYSNRIRTTEIYIEKAMTHWSVAELIERRDSGALHEQQMVAEEAVEWLQCYISRLEYARDSTRRV